MENVGAYGGGKAGGAFDPITFIQRPQVIIRVVCWVSEFNNIETNKILYLCHNKIVSFK